jgi:hypothetical protein
MTVGFILDKGEGSSKVASWIEGSPVLGWFSVKTRGKATYEIQTWRCTRCGFLESYAGG